MLSTNEWIIFAALFVAFLIFSLIKKAIKLFFFILLIAAATIYYFLQTPT